MASKAAVLEPRPVVMSMRDVLALCKRLEARSANATYRDQPELCRDMRLAAGSMRVMARSFHGSDVLTVLDSGVAGQTRRQT
jgi:hypothetical protein